MYTQYAYIPHDMVILSRLADLPGVVCYISLWLSDAKKKIENTESEK